MTNTPHAPLTAKQTPTRPDTRNNPSKPSGGSPETHHAPATDLSPVTELRSAVAKLRKLIAAVPAEHWGNRPWHVEECSDTDTMESCPCIVAQGEYRAFDQPQIPPVQYVADAETREHAAYIATMHPAVAALLADWLDLEADVIAARVVEDGSGEHAVDLAGDHALAIARLINGEEQGR